MSWYYHLAWASVIAKEKYFPKFDIIYILQFTDSFFDTFFKGILTLLTHWQLSSSKLFAFLFIIFNFITIQPSWFFWFSLLHTNFETNYNFLKCIPVIYHLFMVDTYFVHLIKYFASYTEFEQFFNIISIFHVISKGFLSK